MQAPPIFCAVKINGHSAYAVSRKGKDVKLEPRKITVYSIEIVSYSWPFVTIDIKCAKGFYVRSLARDLGNKLKVGGDIALKSEGQKYITRPAISEKRLPLTNHRKVRHQQKTSYRDGTTHMIFEPMDFISKLAALVPTPRVNRTRFRGVFAPNRKHRARVTPAKRGKGSHKLEVDQEEQTSVQRHVAITWAQRLKRVFNIDAETCRVCGGHQDDTGSFREESAAGIRGAGP
jgi:tRNA U55 pseudouridine synthase TruB